MEPDQWIRKKKTQKKQVGVALDLKSIITHPIEMRFLKAEYCFLCCKNFDWELF